MSSLIWFPNSWMCNEQLIHCFTLCITVKFKKNTRVNSVTLTACESWQAGYNKMYASCVSYCMAHHSNPLWYKQYFTTHTHSDTTPHKQEIYLLWLKYLVLSARPFLLPKATERWKTARHAAGATTTTTRPPESEGRRVVQDSTRPFQSPRSDTQKRWFQRERKKQQQQWYQSRQSSKERQVSAVEVLRRLGAAWIQWQAAESQWWWGRLHSKAGWCIISRMMKWQGSESRQDTQCY